MTMSTESWPLPCPQVEEVLLRVKSEGPAIASTTFTSVALQPLASSTVSL